MNSFWQAVAVLIIRGRLYILLVIAALTAYMWSVRGTEIVHNFSHMILSDDDAALSEYQRFQQIFGDDGNVMVASLEGDLFSYEYFTRLYDLTEELQKRRGVENVISITHLYDLVRDDSLEAFRLRRMLAHRPTTPQEVDSLAAKLRSLPFYDALTVEDSIQTTLLAVTFNDSLLDSDQKIAVLSPVRESIMKFGERFGFEPRLAGLPVVRVHMHETVRSELYFFLVVAMVVTAITLLVFFRSLYTMFFPMLVVGVVVIWTMGTIGLLGYKISLLLGIVPSLITVIAIPNAVYFITKYHIEYRLCRSKMKALIFVVQKIGIVTVMTNLTTAVGLGVTALSTIRPLQEFGVVSGLSVVISFVLSLLMIPVVLSYLPDPKPRETAHLDRKFMMAFIEWIIRTVHKRRPAVFVSVFLLAVFSAWGMSRVKAVSYMTDDVPESGKVMRDLRYIEQRYHGALPFEIMIETSGERGVVKRRALQDISALQDSLRKYPDLSYSMSVANVAMYMRQAYFEGGEEAYGLPNRDEYNFIAGYLRNTSLPSSSNFAKVLTDPAYQVTRVSASVRDIGSLRMKQLVDSVQQDIRATLDSSDYRVSVTGTTQVYIKANETLIENLIQSIIIAFLVIALLMGLVFRSLRMILISLVPNFLPLMMLAGLMGWTGIALKPSTAIVFSMAFGIAVDDTLHFLARYRLARKLGDSLPDAVSNSFRDTGMGMIYTSLILFFGFICFLLSEFGGTRNLGVLVSTTLLFAIVSNLLFLPSLILSFARDEENPPLRFRKKRSSKPDNAPSTNPLS